MLNYSDWVRLEAARIKADGCTGVSEWNHECCLEHDLACHYGRDPRSAYLLYKVQTGRPRSNPWVDAKRLGRRRADYAFLRCNEGKARSPVGGLRAFVRFLGVRVGALLGVGVRKATSRKW